MKNLKKRDIVFYLLLAIFIVAADQVTKFFVDARLPYQKSMIIIDKFFYFTYTHNYGAAWSFLEGATPLFIIIAIVAVILLAALFKRTQPEEILTRFGVVLITSGAIGNVIDRIVYGYVRDFIDFVIFGYDFPIFNIADIAICVGIFLVILESVVEEWKIWKLSKSLPEDQESD